MIKFLHPASEIFEYAKSKIDQSPEPETWDELRKMTVKYTIEEENKEVVYTVTFQPFFEGQKFDHWGHVNTEMHISEIKR